LASAHAIFLGNISQSFVHKYMDIDIVVLWQVEVAFASVKATDQKVLYSLRLQLENNLPHFLYKLPRMYL